MITPEQVLAALRRFAEGPASDGWKMVYLDNAKGDLALTGHQFAGYLSVLEGRGQYRPVDNFAWGQVRILGASE